MSTVVSGSRRPLHGSNPAPSLSDVYSGSGAGTTPITVPEVGVQGVISNLERLLVLVANEYFVRVRRPDMVN